MTEGRTVCSKKKEESGRDGSDATTHKRKRGSRGEALGDAGRL